MKLPQDEFRSKTIIGLVWSTISQGGQQFFMLIITVFLIRLLSPEDYGLLAMILIIVGFSNAVSNFGFGPAIIQKQDVNQTDLSSVFWLNIVTGFIMTIFVAFCALNIAQFYGEPRLEIITYLLAPIFLISSFNVVQRMLLAKAINFKNLAKIELFAPILAGIIAVLLAWYGWGIWSLVIQQLILYIVTAILLWGYNNWRPTWEFSFDSIKSMARFSINVFANQSLKYWTKQLDQLLIGKFFTPIDLGIYNRAIALVLKPIRSILVVINRVMFPSFSSIQHEKKKVALIYLRIIEVVSFLVFPAMIGLFVVSESFVQLVFGSKWLAMIPFLQIFCGIGILQAINTLPDSVLYAMGRSDLAFKIGLFQKTNTVILIIIGIQWGMIGIAAGILLSEFVNIWPKLYFGGRLLGLSVFDQLKVIINTIICAVLMGLITYYLQFALEGIFLDSVILGITILAGSLFYVFFAFLLKLRPLKEGKKAICKILSN